MYERVLKIKYKKNFSGYGHIPAGMCMFKVCLHGDIRFTSQLYCKGYLII